MKNKYFPIYRTGLGQDSHRFLSPNSTKPCTIAGHIFDDAPGFQSNSDGDVVFHALCNAVTSLTGVQIMGEIAENLCFRDGITDSEVYLREGLKTLGAQEILHVAITLEGKRPQFKDHIKTMQQNIARILGISTDAIGITAISGEGLTDFGCGDGIQCFAIISTIEQRD